jgi:23S rRNA (guanosine2251-2'-O)-methyltransferase
MNPAYNRSKPTLPKHRLIIGRKPLLEAFQNATEVDKIFLLQTATGEEISAIKKIARERDITCSLVPAEKLHRFTRANHQGVVAIVGLVRYQPLQEIISRAVDKGEAPLIVLLDGITDTRNLGAIARAAYCYGAHALVIPSANNAAITEEAVKTSAGALEHLPVCRVASVQQAIDTLQLNGIQTLASTLESETVPGEIDLRVPVALILGSEDKGVSPYVLKKSDHLARIPMAGNFDSLNVAVAAGILLYETFSQRNVSR